MRLRAFLDILKKNRATASSICDPLVCSNMLLFFLNISMSSVTTNLFRIVRLVTDCIVKDYL